MQLKKLQKRIDELQPFYGSKNLMPIYGTGCILNTDTMFVFINPTARNISSHIDWKGLRAPWLGTKDVWGFFYELNIFPKYYFEKIKKFSAQDWSYNFAFAVYKEIKKKKLFITNLAKCTQIDARPLKNNVFKKYLQIMKQEISFTNPKKIITFGNQVSSIILEKPVSVSNYKGKQKEIIKIGKQFFNVFPVYYPVGQGKKNMAKAIKRIKTII